MNHFAITSIQAPHFRVSATVLPSRWFKAIWRGVLLGVCLISGMQPAQACKITNGDFTGPSPVVVGKRMKGATLANFSSLYSVSGCTNLSSGTDMQSASFGSGLYNSLNAHSGDYHDVGPDYLSLTYAFSGYPYSSPIKENIKFVVKTTYSFRSAGGGSCNMGGSVVPMGTGEFKKSNLNLGWTGSTNSAGPACDGFTIIQNVTVIQTEDSLKNTQAITFESSDLPQVSLKIAGWLNLLPSAKTGFKLVPAPSCTFAANSQNLQVVLGSLQQNYVDKTNTTKPLLTKPFSLNLTSCTSQDQARKVNLTWTFNKPNPHNASRLSNQKSDGAKGVDVMVIAADNQKMALDTGTAYADLTIKNLETYRALNNASNVSLNFKAAFVANGEEPAPGIFSSTATVMLSYE